MASSSPKPRKPKPPTPLDRTARIWLTVNSINDDDGAVLWRTTLAKLQRDIEDYKPPRWATPNCTEALFKTSQDVHELLDKISDICYTPLKRGGWERVEPTGFNTDIENQAKVMVLAHVRYVRKWIDTVSGEARDLNIRNVAQTEVDRRHSVLSQQMDSIRWTLRIKEVYERTPTPTDTTTSDGATSVYHVPDSSRRTNSSHAAKAELNSSSPSSLSSSAAHSTQVLSSPSARAPPRSIGNPPASLLHAEHPNPLAMLTRASWEEARRDDSSIDQE